MIKSSLRKLKSMVQKRLGKKVKRTDEQTRSKSTDKGGSKPGKHSPTRDGVHANANKNANAKKKTSSKNTASSPKKSSKPVNRVPVSKMAETREKHTVEVGIGGLSHHSVSDTSTSQQQQQQQQQQQLGAAAQDNDLTIAIDIDSYVRQFTRPSAVFPRRVRYGSPHSTQNQEFSIGSSRPVGANRPAEVPAASWTELFFRAVGSVFPLPLPTPQRMPFFSLR